MEGVGATGYAQRPALDAPPQLCSCGRSEPQQATFCWSLPDHLPLRPDAPDAQNALSGDLVQKSSLSGKMVISQPPGRQHTAKKSTRTRRGILWCRSVRQCRPPVASVALGAACVGRPRVPHFLFDARVDAGIDSRIAPVIVILAKACLGKICCKTGAKRRQRAHPRTQRGDPAARRPSARRALAPRERGGSGRNRRGV